MTNMFSPIRVGPYLLQNRIVMAPMTRSRASDTFVPQAISATYYGQRASAGLIITEAAQVSAQGAGYPCTPGIYNAEQVAGWMPITQEVHERGGRVFLQLWHAGRISHPSIQPLNSLPVAPSATRPDGQLITKSGLQPYVTPRSLGTEEIGDVVSQFSEGARNALDAGFDGVELHAANGYLLDQFLRSGSNQRTDQYGGSVENRARLLLEVTEAVTAVWGSDKVGVHISPLVDVHSVSDEDPETLFGYVARTLGKDQLAYLHVFEAVIPHPQTPSRSFDLQQLRRAFSGTYIANGGYDATRANAALASGQTDLVSFAKLFISNPDLPDRLRRQLPLSAADPATFYQGGVSGYTDYPQIVDTDLARS